MFRLKTKRAALALYGALLVLPTLVVGWLYWQELVDDYQSQLDDVPRNAQDGAQRVLVGMRGRLQLLVESESERPFYHYGPYFAPQAALGDDIVVEPSPLARRVPPPGILSWFSYDSEDPLAPPEAIDIFPEGEPGRDSWVEGLRPIFSEFRERKGAEDYFERMSQLGGIETLELPMATVAIHRADLRDDRERTLACFDACATILAGRRSRPRVSKFTLEFYRSPGGAPRLFASRHVLLFPAPPGSDLPADATCLRPVLRGFGLLQGFLIDPDWLFDELPRSVAETSLRESEELVPYAPAGQGSRASAAILPLQELGFRAATAGELEFGRFDVRIDTQSIDDRFARQSRRFLAVGAMLVLTLAAGMILLYRSVTSELEQAHRMQNFVAAVTHELRTPVATIRLHGEMLAEGWTTDEAKRQEYYERIVNETNRLSTLVERVLEKSRLKDRGSEPIQASLNDWVRECEASLASAPGAAGDIEFDLADDLPQVWLTPEAVAAILSNLVENARKYAAPEPGGEPIRVETALERDRVLLRVSDRGPGVPKELSELVFEAFYRVGNEATRTTQGTGLGLHLVHMHAQSVAARASVRSRDGGGSVFEVAFRPVV